MAHDDAREGKWMWNWRMELVAITLHTTSEHGVSRVTTADAHTSADSSRLNWHPRRFKWTRPFLCKTESGFCACAITFQTQSASWHGDCRPIHCGETAVGPELCVGTCGGRVEANETIYKQIVLRKTTDCNDNLSCPHAIPVTCYTSVWICYS
jgi:hypothetical protein